MISLHLDTLSYDDGDILIDAVEAEYEIDATWSRHRRNGYRSVERVNSITLLWWGSSKRTREEAVQIIGQSAVQAEEYRALNEWLQRAVNDEADEYADYARDSRMSTD